MHRVVERSVLSLSTAVLLASAPAWAGQAKVAEGEELVRVAASERYKAARVHRFVLGGGYRDLWQAEIELPVLKLEVASGPLKPFGRFGGLQTAVLAMTAPDGRSFSFRGTDKDPSNVLPAVLRDTAIETLVQDQMAAQHPGGPIASSVLSEAAGLLTVHERMVVMPDDPALGEFREEFAGMVGAFFEFPLPKADGHPGFHGATEIIDYKELYERLEHSQEDQVDVEAFLRARLYDILIGDFDRHRKQWRWAKIPGNPRWQPIPEDRDMAFVRYDGAGPRVASIYVPILQNYGPDYPFIKGLTMHGWEQDRWLLPALSWEQWEPIALDIQARITDEVIEQAIEVLPPEYVELDGDRLRHDLRGRRDRLLEGARSFYDHLAGEVDVQASDDAEAVAATWAEDGSLQVDVREVGAADAEALYSRRFEPCETRDVRIYLRDGDDRVTVSGEPGCTQLRVIAGAGEKVVDDSAAGRTRIYDEGGNVDVRKGPRTSVDERPYVEPEGNAGFVDVKDIPPRDWGTDTIPIPVFGYEKDVGVFLGAGVVHTRYGFRKHPWSSRHRVTAGWATEAERARVTYGGTFRLANSDLVTNLDLKYSGIEMLRFYGFGNETSDDAPDGFFRVRSRQSRVAPSLEIRFMDEQVRVAGGPWMEYWRTQNGQRLIDLNRPYGAGRFGLIGAFANVQFDTRRTVELIEGQDLALPLHENPAAGYPTSGFLVDITSEVSPPVWDVNSTWGAIEGSVSGFYSFGDRDRATLALRVGGRETWGNTPYFKAAFIGGGEFFSGNASVRGLRAQRFSGDSSVFGNLDLRVFLARIKLIVPTDVGVMGFGDVGRVFEDGESSKDWHPGAGGGVWLAPLARTNAITFAVAKSDEETLFYMRIGFFF
jgi:hypothetical protein